MKTRAMLLASSGNSCRVVSSSLNALVCFVSFSYILKSQERTFGEGERTLLILGS